MRFVLSGFIFLIWILLNSLHVFAAGGSTNSNTQETEYQLDVNTKQETQNSKYSTGSFDGLDAHILYSKENSKATNVVDGSSKIWDGSTDEHCLGSLLISKNGEKKLLVLPIRKKSTTDPIEGKLYKLENNEWKEKNKQEYYQELENLRVEDTNSQDQQFNLSSTQSPNVSKISESANGFTVNLFLPDKGFKINNIVDGNNKIWERDSNTQQYAVNFLFAKNGNDKKKAGIVAIRKSNSYEEKYFVFENNRWKSVEFDGFKKYIVKAVASAAISGALRGGSKKGT